MQKTSAAATAEVRKVLIMVSTNSVLDNADEEGYLCEESGKASVAVQLLRLARANYDFGRDVEGHPFAVRKGGHVTIPLKGSTEGLRNALAFAYYKLTTKMAPSKALAEAMMVILAECERSSPTNVWLRVGRVDGELFVDLGDAEERVVWVTPDGWEVLEPDAAIPVLFRRTSASAPLPLPERGGDLEALWKFVNVADEDERQLLRAWLVAALVLVEQPVPVLALLAEHGTAKTTTTRKLVSMVDPSRASTTPLPKDSEQLKFALYGSRVAAFDNVSNISNSMSDAMCRAVTGDADKARKFYSDSDLHIINFRSVVAFNGIDVGVLAGDLAERSLWVTLGRIDPSQRRTEREVDRAWASEYGSLFGGLVSLVVAVLAEMPHVQLQEMPRMADFAEVLAAVDKVNAGSGLPRYIEAQATLLADIAEVDVFARSLVTHLKSHCTITARELLEWVEGMAPAARLSDKYWPTLRSIDGRLKRLAPSLRAAGWVVEETRRDPVRRRAKQWILVPPGVQQAQAAAGNGDSGSAQPAQPVETQEEKIARLKRELAEKQYTK